VLSGSGDCVLDDGRVPLRPGLVFAIDPGIRHCFESGAEGLSVAAYHPDSEGGPTDESHPMLNRTYRQ
jgi:mannose-6-phosphate isomerase-like protein (cupin superfamily)